MQDDASLPTRHAPVNCLALQPGRYAAQLAAAQNRAHSAAFAAVLAVARSAATAGGRALLVGGSVRDLALGNVARDYDLELYGLPSDTVEALARVHGTVNPVGKAFGILKLHTDQGIDLDLSLPRLDSRVGVGHRGFAVKTNPFMSIADAARRRDFTVNSMAWDPLSGELFDPFEGLADLAAGRLRVTDSERFADDPLRVLRAVQLLARFNLVPDQTCAAILRTQAAALRTLPRERVLDEWTKLLLKAERPSLGLRVGQQLGLFDDLHPAFRQMAQTPQEPEWHPEGDVWTHSWMAVDQAARIARREGLNAENTLVLLWAVLLHDIGKITTTAVVDGRIISPGHDEAGAPLAKEFLQQLGVDTRTREKVVPLVQNHMWIFPVFEPGAAARTTTSDRAIRRLAIRLFPATIAELMLVCEADRSGRGTWIDTASGELCPPGDFEAGAWLRARARRLEAEHGRAPSLLQGRDLLALDLVPGREFGTVIDLANRLRDAQYYDRDAVLALLTGTHSAAEAIGVLSAQLGDDSESTVTRRARRQGLRSFRRPEDSRP